eukprot:TRINITY_DN3152_c0_g1_i4.p2 TRINITY_DN3152_c0_g1~~TRINITY_DN3152_c0_g1_i4.p2  ORF type:complete len:772 (+),score=315.78 TRINITY_DN3152_c0_g1_i4:58-2373(+)
MSEAKEQAAYQTHCPEYTSNQVHDDLERDAVIGVYGGANAVYHGIAEAKLGDVDLLAVHKKRSQDEYYIPEINEHLHCQSTQTRWNEIVTFDPWGMWASRPTISATTARMYLPELKGLEPFPGVVSEDGGIEVQKIAIDYVFNLPGLAKRLNISEKLLRDEMYKYTQNDRMYREDFRTFLPPIGGITVYIFGDIRKLEDPKNEVAVRVHDECNGSDVFCTDICTCRPYLIFSIEGAVECAKRGGVGFVIYFRKEGRALGEVTKFRVYNARKQQPGGDRPEMYFHQTESIAGIRDARFQDMMPDVLLWLGIRRIDWYFSMSSDKYDAITAMRVNVMQRVPLPDSWVPKGAQVEITAKISAGYHTENISSDDISQRLRQPDSIRHQCQRIYALAEQDNCRHFTLHKEKLPEVVAMVCDVIRRNYPDLNIPHHSRLRHFEAGGIDRLTPLLNSWRCDQVEKVRRVIDLITISVLLDAGAGPEWKYVDAEGNAYTRSEGLAVASVAMFEEGLFSSDPAMPHRVNSMALKNLQVSQLIRGFQVNSHNQMVGLEGRTTLLQRLGQALEDNPDFFGYEIVRPGNMVDALLRQAQNNHVSIRALWSIIVDGFASIWPATLSGVRRGDIWVYPPLKQIREPGSDMIPFHKLPQWLMFSILEPVSWIGLEFDDLNVLTGLAEYRNGGLFVDTGVLELRNPNSTLMTFPVGSELIVEWRALTICLLDLVADAVRREFGKTEAEWPISKILQGGTWAAGREIAKSKRADASPPIVLRSDGTVF